MSLETKKNPRDIILKPVVSEKSYALIDHGQYTFEVDPRSNKVKVASVNTQNREGKRVRTRTGWGRRKDVKRAIVTLREGTIDVFGMQG